MVSVAGWLVRLLAVALIAAGPVMLPALAYASPPDPSWLPGVYDDADFDDVVTFVTSSTGHSAVAVPADVAPAALVAARLAEVGDGLIVVDPLFLTSPRGPPALLAPIRGR
ncbi:MAG TPA: hypothetical protein VKD67_11470 [Acidimicrobiales bacterium]|nr:hypothetical protein [Acidimicrobiales bacterium]